MQRFLGHAQTFMLAAVGGVMAAWTGVACSFFLSIAVLFIEVVSHTFAGGRMDFNSILPLMGFAMDFFKWSAVVLGFLGFVYGATAVISERNMP